MSYKYYKITNRNTGEVSILRKEVGRDIERGFEYSYFSSDECYSKEDVEKDDIIGEEVKI